MKTQKLKHYHLTMWLLAFGFLLTTGMKCKKDGNLFGKNQLPRITQESKNTFGFLLNGEVWVPKAPILRSKLDLSYDPTYNGGALVITAQKYFSDTEQSNLSIGGININKIGTYIFEPTFKNVGFYSTKSCNYIDDNVKISESITITRLDLTGNKIISGTFEFKLEKESCPTINASQGIFDLKIE